MPHLSSPRPLLRLAALFVTAALAVTACGGDEDVSQADFSKDLRELLGENVASDDVIDCLTKAIFEDFDQETVNEIYVADNEADLDPDVRDKLFEINQGCYEAEQADAEDEGGGESSTSEPSDTTDTTTEGTSETSDSSTTTASTDPES